MRMENLCLGAHPGSLNKNLVARTPNLGAPGDRAPVRQQPWGSTCSFIVSDVSHKKNSIES